MLSWVVGQGWLWSGLWRKGWRRRCNARCYQIPGLRQKRGDVLCEAEPLWGLPQPDGVTHRELRHKIEAAHLSPSRLLSACICGAKYGQGVLGVSGRVRERRSDVCPREASVSDGKIASHVQKQGEWKYCKLWYEWKDLGVLGRSESGGSHQRSSDCGD